MMNSSSSHSEGENASLPPTEFSVVLSREEVLAILHLIGLATIPGLGEEPLPNLSPEQQAISLIVAERALRARGLAAINAEGRLLVQTTVLETLGVCAFATRSVYVTQMVAPSGGAAQLIGHRRAEAWVVHTRPELVLHAFQRTDSWPKVMEQIITFCGWPGQSAGAEFRLTVANSTLKTIRELAAQGQVDRANALLLAARQDAEAAKKLVDLLSQPHFVTVVQWITPESSDAIAVQSITILHHDQVLLVAVEPAGTEEQDDKSTVIQTTSIERLEQMLTELALGRRLAGVDK